MSSTSSQEVERRARVEQLDRLSDTLDARFTLPGLGIPVGWDSILGLIPGIGDIVTAGPGVLMACEGYRLGARKRALAGIGVNTGIDMIIGGLPVIGDAFDIFFKSHRRNVEILKRELERIEAIESKEETWQSERDRKTGAATPKAESSAQEAAPINQGALAGDRRATSRPGTN